MQPGDNFRITASTDGDDILDLTQEVVDDAVQNTGDLPDGVVLSDMLTVWRKLHLEGDSMGEQPEYGDQGRKVTGTVRRISSTTNASGQKIPTRVDLSVDLTSLPAGPDDSEHLTILNQENKGRFEEGTFWIGAGEEGPGKTQTNLIDGNGQVLDASFVQKMDGFKIPFTLSKGMDSVSGFVGEFFMDSVDTDKGYFTLDGYDPADLTDAFAGGTLNVAGVAMTASSVTPSGTVTVTVNNTPDIPFELADDDAESLPMEVRMSETIDAYARAYIDVILDGGGDVANNQDDIEFRRNISNFGLDNEFAEFVNPGATEPDEGIHQSYHNREDSFWVAYVLMGWEAHETNDLDGEDEQEERRLAGATAIDERFGSIIYVEQIHDMLDLTGTPNQEFFEKVGHFIAHEIGHQFHINHEHGALMSGTDTPVGMPGPSSFFAAADIARIRNRVSSPGAEETTVDD